MQHSTDQQTQSSSLIEWAVARKEKAQEPHRALVPVVKSSPGGTVAALIDAEGFGQKALDTAQAAASILESYTHQSLIDLFARTEHGCRGTDGISMGAAVINTGYNTISWYGVGSIQCVLFRRSPAADPRVYKLERTSELLGTGQCMLRELCLPIKPGDLLFFASEGISEAFIDALPIDGKPRVVADQLLANYCKEEMDCAMVVVRYLGA